MNNIANVYLFHSHVDWRRELKKIRRKKKRQKLAIVRKHEEHLGKQ